MESISLNDFAIESPEAFEKNKKLSVLRVSPGTARQGQCVAN
jgi:hypothetical protein